MDSKTQEVKRDSGTYDEAKASELRPETASSLGRPGGLFEMRDMKNASEHIQARIRTLEIEAQVAAAAARTWQEKSEEAYKQANEIRHLFRKISQV